MNDYERIGDGIGKAFIAICIALVISVPLGLWKLFEIVKWVFENVSIFVK